MNTPNTSFQKTPLGACMLISSLLVSDAVYSFSGLEEIVVTARKRSENIQDVPISIYAKTGEALKNAGINDSLAIDEMVPNLEIKTFGGQPNIFIRGVGNNDFNATTISPVSIYSDGVLLGLTGSQSMPMYDIERVEVLRGPQGTLFGRNTTGGALVFHSRKPGNEFELDSRLNVGNNSRLDGEIATTLPLTDNTGVRLAGVRYEREGDRYNITTGENVNAFEMSGARAILVSKPSDSLELTLNVHWSEDRSDFRLGRQASDNPDILGWVHPESDNDKYLYLDGPNRHFADQKGASIIAEWQSDNITLKSITAFEKADTDFCGDIDQSPNSLDHLCFVTQGEQYSQELNLSGSAGESTEWIVGFYFLNEDMTHSTEGLLFGDTPFALPVDGLSHRITDTYAVFAETTHLFTDRLKFNAGLRYTYEDKEADVESAINLSFIDPSLPNMASGYLVPYEELTRNWEAVSGRLALSYDLNESAMIYGSFSSGFKSGGFNLGSFFDPNEVTTVDPEYLYSYELGLKSDIFNQRLRLNISGFYYDYSDLQVYTYAAGSSPATPVVFALENAADAEIYGMEVELDALPTDRLRVQIGLGLIHSEYKDFVSLVGGDLSGNKLPGAPELSGNLAVEYSLPTFDRFNTTARVEYSYTGKRYFNPFEDEAISSRGSHELINARISLSPQEDSWELAVWGKNLTDENYIVDATDLKGTFGMVPLYLGDLRSYGIELSLKFN